MLSLKQMRDTYKIRLFSMAKIPLLAYIRPRILELNEQRCTVEIPLRRRVMNHFNSMYFGSLCMGAELAGGLIAFDYIRRSRAPVHFVFKDFSAQFLKRATGDVAFHCADGERLIALIDRCRAGRTREEESIAVHAYVPEQFAEQPVATFTLTISAKSR